ncbi:ATP-binding protein [Rhodococcus qingshengii]|uniref:HAMP domain-containing sensor histidine kinase n=1 Tax=Rhodococcus qingshengii TaxID=334542 RepID=UPI0036DE8C8F
MLRTRLTLVSLTAAVVAIGITVYIVYLAVAPLVTDQVERGLSDRVDTVLAILDAGAALPIQPDMTEQLLHADGTIQLLTPGRTQLPVTADDRSVASTGHGTADSEAVVHGKTIIILTRARTGGGAVMVGQNYTDIERIDSEFWWRTVWITAIVVGVVAVFSWLLVGRILRPIRRLVGATNRIATTQDLSVMLPQSGGGEVGELARSFNTMVTALRFSRSQQQRLVHDAGHELRTPLTSVRGSAELLQRARGKLTEEDETQVLTTLVEEAKALDMLIGELVDLATDQHTVELPTVLELYELAEDCAKRFHRRTGRTIDIVCDSAVAVTARRQALTRCVDNLLDNAIKYSPPDSPVELRICGTIVSVHDAGPGIATADQDAIFDRFYRADRTRATPGSGLGLAIVHDLISAHNGTVFARNHPGGGAEVGFQLPSRN